MKLSELPKKSKIHMIAIGGTGMRALAIILHQMGHIVSGSDINTENDSVRNLRELGINVYHGHDEKNLDNPDIVIRSAIIPDNNPEVSKATELKIPVINRTDAVTELANTKRIFAVAGSHGKSTATSMLVHILKKENIPFSWYYGSQLKDGSAEAYWDSNSEWLILETDESDHGFIRYNTTIGTVLCIDPEHMEFYDFDFNNLLGEFSDFIEKSVSNHGVQILSFDDLNTNKIFDKCQNLITFGKQDGADLRFDGPVFKIIDGKMGSSSKISFKGREFGMLELTVPGEHNIQNALSAVAGAAQFGISLLDSISDLKDYPGLKRRIEQLGNTNEHIMFDDDAGHPSELSAGIKTLKQYFPDRPLCIIHQPVRFSRVYYLADEYAKVINELLDKNDRYIASPAHASDENKWGVDKNGISNTVKNLNPQCHVEVLDSSDEIIPTINRDLKKGEIIFFSGHPPNIIRNKAFEFCDDLKNNK